MKYANKMMLVPYTQNPEAQYQSEMDQEMSKIISSKLKPDEKIKKYNDFLSNYTSNCRENEEVKEPTVVPDVKAEPKPVPKVNKFVNKSLLKSNQKLVNLIKKKLTKFSNCSNSCCEPVR
jgi:hypothetical protein